MEVVCTASMTAAEKDCLQRPLYKYGARAVRHGSSSELHSS